MMIYPIDLQSGNPDGIAMIHLASSQQCFDADEQLRESEWFGEIVIRSCFKVFYLIVHRITGGQYKDWYSGIMSPQPRDKFGPAQFRKHQINDEKVIRRPQSHFEASSAISGVVDGKPFRFES